MGVGLGVGEADAGELGVPVGAALSDTDVDGAGGGPTFGPWLTRIASTVTAAAAPTAAAAGIRGANQDARRWGA